jgi:myo-inositol-1(or 4)-monophosphatase
MDSKMDFKALCEATIEIAVEAGNYIHGRLKSVPLKAVEVKGMNNFVTDVDKTAEAMIISKLNLLVKEAGFIAEEGTNTTKGEHYNWIIDPLDGTTNFIHGAPPVAVSIALVNDGIPVVGVIYEIFMKEVFYAWEGSNAYLNGEIITVSDNRQLKDSLIAVGFPYNDQNQLKRFMNSLEHFFTSTHGVRRLGSAATDLAYVACGRYDGFYEYNLSPWDVAAGALIVKQAGGKVSDFKGGDNYIFGREIIAGNKGNHQELLKDISSLMKP